MTEEQAKQLKPGDRVRVRVGEPRHNLPPVTIVIERVTFDGRPSSTGAPLLDIVGRTPAGRFESVLAGIDLCEIEGQ